MLQPRSNARGTSLKDIVLWERPAATLRFTPWPLYASSDKDYCLAVDEVGAQRTLAASVL